MSAEELLLRRAVVSGFALLYWAGVLVQARRIRRQIGRSPNLKPRGTKEKMLWLGWLLVILIWITQPLFLGTSPGAQLMDGFISPAGLGLGIALTVLGYGCTLWCYAAMGNTWRIGVNAAEKTTLVDRGPYRRVRHPIYLFQIVTLTGGALLLPTVLSFAILAVHYVCVLIKAVDEENYLLGVHGEDYRNYLARTGRLFPRLFR